MHTKRNGDATGMHLAENIKMFRQKSLLTQEEFAKVLCVAPSTVNRWETGKARPNLSAMKKPQILLLKECLPNEKLESEWLNLPEGKNNI
jgi:DNA-binding transcriptional regulator YiaG